MTITTPETIASLSLHEVPQQFLAGEGASTELEFKLGRACTAHCVAVVQANLDPTRQTSVAELVEFVLEHGAESGSELYTDGVGWQHGKLADLMRLNGFRVISQNLRYGPDAVNIRAASTSGRVRSEYEKSRLVLYGARGGGARSQWLEPLQTTLDFAGAVVASIQIPLLSGNGNGSHAVVLTEIDEDAGLATYFDPDYYNTRRYGEKPPQIEPLPGTALMYRRPIVDLLGVMTGEVMHVFPPVIL